MRHRDKRGCCDRMLKNSWHSDFGYRAIRNPFFAAAAADGTRQPRLRPSCNHAIVSTASLRDTTKSAYFKSENAICIFFKKENSEFKIRFSRMAQTWKHTPIGPQTDMQMVGDRKHSILNIRRIVCKVDAAFDVHGCSFGAFSPARWYIYDSCRFLNSGVFRWHAKRSLSEFSQTSLLCDFFFHVLTSSKKVTTTTTTTTDGNEGQQRQRLKDALGNH